MKIYTSRASSLVDEKTTLLTSPNVTEASNPYSQLTDFRKTVGASLQRAGEWLHGLPSDRGIMVELDAWEENEEIHSQLTNAFIDHFQGINMGNKPSPRTVRRTGIWPKVPLDHVIKVIDRTLGDTELEKELVDLDGKISEWKQRCASISPGSGGSRIHCPWAADVTPLLGKTIKANNKINRKRGKEDTEASIEKGEKGSIEEGSVFSGDSHQSEFAVSVVSVA